MYKIFCVLNGLYIKAWHRYKLISSKGEEAYFWHKGEAGLFYQSTGEQFLVTTSTVIHETLPEVADGSFYTNIFVREDYEFKSLLAIEEFTNTWFSKGIFQGVYIPEQFKIDAAKQYANGDEQYTYSAYEIHRIVNDKIVEHAAICDCIRFNQ